MSKSNNRIHEGMYGLKRILDAIPTCCHLRLDVFNDFTLPVDWGFENRVNPNFHIALVRRGDGCYTFGNETESMSKGKLFFVSPGFAHSRSLDSERLPRAALLRFSVMDNQKLLPVTMGLTPFAFAVTPGDTARFYALFSALGDYYGLRRLKNREQLCSHVLTQILLELFNDLDSRLRPSSCDKRLEAAAAYMEQNLEKEISCDDLARCTGLSRNYFRQCFFRQYGMNPKQYHIQLRIRKSMELLNETGYSIKEIAAMLGYSDAYAFSKQFKAVAGRSPLQAKKPVIS